MTRQHIQITEPFEQPVYEGPSYVAGSMVDDQAWWLVHDDQLVVLKYDRERDSPMLPLRLRGNRRLRRMPRFFELPIGHLEALVFVNLAASLEHDGPVDPHCPERDELRRGAPGNPGQHAHRAVDALSGEGSGHYGEHR